MSKVKKLEQEIQELRNMILQLQSQMLALYASRPVVVTAPPNTMPSIQPNITPTPGLPRWTPTDRPYIGDTAPGRQWSPTITCGSKTEVSGSSNQVSRCC